jgi:DNA-binding CsgD family transcriptional regulator
MEASHELLHELESSVGEELDATEMIQAVDKRLLLGLRFGTIGSLARARQVSELLPAVEDPVLRCSFGSSFSCALNLAAEYTRALEVATAMVEDANEYRVDFATPYGYLMQGAALAGLRRFEEAHEALSESQAAATRCGDSFGEQAVYAGRVRALLHEGRIREACALEPPDLTDAFPAMRGEVWASRGLALACMGRVVEAKTYVVEVRGKTKAIEPNILALAIAAVSGLKLRDSELTSLLRSFLQASVSSGAADFVVTTYRANLDMLAALLRDSETAEQTGFIVSRADDRPLAEGIGIDPLAVVDPVSTLTSRERDVYNLLCEGLSNAEIGRRLFISSPTVKVHVRHVYDKLGIRSRTAVALHAASRRAQENPTARGGDSGSSVAEG